MLIFWKPCMFRDKDIFGQSNNERKKSEEQINFAHVYFHNNFNFFLRRGKLIKFTQTFVTVSIFTHPINNSGRLAWIVQTWNTMSKLLQSCLLCWILVRVWSSLLKSTCWFCLFDTQNCLECNREGTKLTDKCVLSHNSCILSFKWIYKLDDQATTAKVQGLILKRKIKNRAK